MIRELIITMSDWRIALQKRSRLVTCLVLLFSIILAIVYIPRLQVSFDFSLMSAKDSTPLKDVGQFLQAQQGTLSVIIKKKDNQTFKGKELCLIREIFNRAQSDLGLAGLESAFDYSLPFSEGNKVFFRPLVEVSCVEGTTKEGIDYLKDLREISTFSLLSNKEKNDLLFRLKISNVVISGMETYKKVQEIKLWLSKNIAQDQYELYYEGNPLIQYYVHDLLLKDIKVNGFIILSFLLLFYLFYRSLKIGLIYLLSLFIGLSWLLPLFVYFQITINPLSASIFIILAIASIEDYIFVVDNYSISTGWGKTFNRFLLPGFVTTLTTCIGFASLGISHIRDIFYFGLLTGLGAMFEWGIIFFLVPCFFQWWKVIAHKGPLLTWSLWEKLNKIRVHKIFAYLSVIIFIISLLVLSKLSVDENTESLFYSDHPFHRNSQYFVETRGSLKRIYILTQDATSIDSLKKKLGAIDQINSVDSYQDFLQPLLHKLSGNAQSYVQNELRDSPLYNQFHINQHGILILGLKDQGWSVTKSTLKQIELVCKELDCESFGRGVSYARYNEEVLKTLYESFFTSFILNMGILILIIYFRRQKNYGWIIYSALWGPVTMVSLFYFFHIPINFITCIFLSVTLGFAGDNAIQYLFYEDELKLEVLDKAGNSSLVISTFSIIGSLIICLSGFRFTAQLGGIFALGFLLNVVGDLFILKGAISAPSKVN